MKQRSSGHAASQHGIAQPSPVALPSTNNWDMPWGARLAEMLTPAGGARRRRGSSVEGCAPETPRPRTVLPRNERRAICARYTDTSSKLEYAHPGGTASAMHDPPLPQLLRAEYNKLPITSMLAPATAPRRHRGPRHAARSVGQIARVFRTAPQPPPIRFGMNRWRAGPRPVAGRGPFACMASSRPGLAVRDTRIQQAAQRRRRAAWMRAALISQSNS